MKLEDLRPSPGSRTSRKRLGRGHGSGHGTTAGKGTKGQKSRSGGKVRPGFEGGQNPIYRRMPYKRGFTNPFKVEYEVVNVGRLAELELESPITPESLYDRGVIRDASALVKILATGEIATAVHVRAHKFSASAREKIEAAGGTAEVIE